MLSGWRSRFIQLLIQHFTKSWMPLVIYMKWLIVIKCHFMWPIISCDLIWNSICVVDTMIFEQKMVSDKNKHVQNWVGKDASCYLRNDQLNPPFSVIYFKGRCSSIYINDVYVDWNIPCISYSPKMLLWSSTGFYLVVCTLYYFKGKVQ